jgi:hypothetical protein
LSEEGGESGRKFIEGFLLLVGVGVFDVLPVFSDEVLDFGFELRADDNFLQQRYNMVEKGLFLGLTDV